MTDVTERLAARIVALAESRRRVLVGIVGTPGAGKSTVAHGVADALTARGFRPNEVAIVPMDGFHLADVTLMKLGRLNRKGALDTFDGDGYVAALRRLRSESARPVYLPGFERELEQPIAAAVTVDPGARIVLTEGLYLLIDAEPWAEIAGLLDESWYLEGDDAVRRERLIARHIEFGKTPDAARRWVDGVDERNAELVRASCARADLIVRV